MGPVPRESPAVVPERALAVALGLGALAGAAFLPLRQGSTFGNAAGLVGCAAVLASGLTLGWALASGAGRPRRARVPGLALGTALVDLVAIYTLFSRLAAF